MRLSELVSQVAGASVRGNADVDVTAVAHDSRLVRPGHIFVAVRGFKADGHDYILQALDAGAAAIAVEAGQEAKWAALVDERQVMALVAPDTRVALAQIAAAVNGHPARRLNVVGVTGTDGKTSLAHLLAHVFSSAGEQAGLISTAECRIGDRPLPDTGRFTTPESPQVQAMLAEMVDAGCRWAVIEATSHGLALHRVDECEYDIAAFTNVGSDHIEFHGSREEYMAAKGRLFQMLDQAVDKGVPKAAVLNVDDPAHGYFAGLTRARPVTYGIDSPADVSADDLRLDGWGSHFTLQASGRRVPVQFRRPGVFNVYNALAAAAVGLSGGIELRQITPALESWRGAPGRMQFVDAGQDFTVIVDFAHAPDSLRRVLRFLRQSCRGRIIAVFGCIGERDKDRRVGMGRVAAECADYTIVTDDNPYTEDRQAIIDEIASGLLAGGRREGHDFALVPDRREAIAQALAMAVDEDVVLLAGKGHEREVHLAGSSYDCNDAEVARRVLSQLQRGW
jgi:UDP-N-acetylmuramoyl-L-alanyl-D-glutamate--2,6-diaminopimelate ligase